MTDEITFLDLLTLSKIGPDTVVEKFSNITNSSFFEASNILGGLKIKGVIDFTTSFPGQSTVNVTSEGKELLDEAEKKATEPFDPLDAGVLFQLSKGNRSLTDLGGALNIRPKDLALHLYKLTMQQYVQSVLKNNGVDLMLTEKGYLNADTTSKQQGPQPAAKPAASEAAKAAQPPAAAAQEQPPEGGNYLEKIIASRKRKQRLTMVAVLVAVVVVVVVLVVFRSALLKI